MNIIILQIILLTFAVFMVYSLFLHWKKKDVSNKLFIFWLVIFGLFIFITCFPKILEPLLKELFIVRVMDLGMVGTFMILTYVTIENNIKIKKLETDMEKIIRRLAIKHTKLKK
jgi:hypothetical protein